MPQMLAARRVAQSQFLPSPVKNRNQSKELAVDEPGFVMKSAKPI
jgi:hypothetical protein